MRQVGVLDRPQPDDLGHLLLLGRIELGAILLDDLERLGRRLVQERLQADDVPFARLERAAIGAQDRAERHVLEVDRVVTPLAGHLEKLLEMIALAMVDHVEDLIGVPGLDAILDRRQVGRRVVEGAIALADDERGLGLFDEDDDRSLAFDGEPPALRSATTAASIGS